MAFANEWNWDGNRDASLIDSVMRGVSAITGPFDYDLFSDRTGRNSRALKWRCPEEPAFEFDEDGDTLIWAFPPKAIAGQTLQ